MRRLSFWLSSCLLPINLVCSLSGLAATGASTSTPSNAAVVLSQLAAAFSGGQLVVQVQLTGNAVWHTGDSEDSGPITLTASASGISQLQLSLSSLGVRTESRSGQGSDQSCTWAGADGISHDTSLNNCWKPVIWFLPAISLQPSLLSPSTLVSDLGAQTTGNTSFRDLQSLFAPQDLSSPVLASLTQTSSTDIRLDPTTFLPAALEYRDLADHGGISSIDILIRYSNYETVNGVQIPFSIQRYINGALQLDITVNAVQIN